MRASFCRRFKSVLTFMLLLYLAGCGDGGDGSTGAAWKYVALGDSLAAGFTASQGYVQRYSQYVQADTGASVTVRNMGVPGWQSGDLLNALRNDADFRAAVFSADIVTWDIGGNDLLSSYKLYLRGNCGGSDNQDCFRSAVANFRINWNGIISELLALSRPGKTILRTMDIYNPFVAEQMVLGNLGQTKPYLDAVNVHIESSAQQNGIRCAKVYLAFNGAQGLDDPVSKGLISIDGFHASDAGHKLMADLLRGFGYAPLN
ncbi:MAG TPA: SGNH/GDSL hydrolase family protein [Clostridia bacterium]|nr:SGNH/GDSL hydrolase family protein [Clostridia bacterium]